MGVPYRICYNCGNHLDPGELCDCLERAQEERKTDQIVPPERASRTASAGACLANRKDFTAAAKPYISRA